MFNKKMRKQSKDEDYENTQSQDSIAETISNPSPCKKQNKKFSTKKSNLLDCSSSEDEDWKTQFIRSIRKDDIEPKEEANKTNTLIKQKYPKQVKNIKTGTVKVKSKENSNIKYEDVCSICLDKYSNIRGHLGCGHKFCFQCIQEWIKSSTRCPCCRQSFKTYVKVVEDQKNVQKKRQVIEVEERVLQFSELDWLICYQCDDGDDEDVLLVCDICQFYCCHVYCDLSLGNFFPEGEWYCKKCKEMMEINERASKKQAKAPIKEKKKESKKYKKQIESATSSDNSSENDEEQDFRDRISLNGPITRSMSISLQSNARQRSKAYEIINTLPSNTANKFAVEMNRVANSTVVNLRNLRRNRIS